MTRATGIPTTAELTQTTNTLAELRQMVGNLARLCEISITLNTITDIRTLLRHLLRTAVEVLDCESASIMLFNEKRGELMFTATSDSDQKKFAEIPVPLKGSIAGTIFMSKEPLLINDVKNDPRHFDAVGLKTNFIPHTLVGVPMTVQGKPIGVLEALNKKRRRFTEQDLHLLAILASQAAVAIHNSRLNHAVQNAYDDLQKADKMKSDFMAIASHELRTPLGIILGYASFLKDEADDNISGHAEQIVGAAVRLQTVIEAMTKMNSLQAGNMDTKFTPVPIQSVLRAAIKECSSQAWSKNIHYSIRFPDEQILVTADANKLKTVFSNILNNAVQFTHRGGTIITHVEDRPKECWVRIKDNGLGLSKEHLKRIFDQFFQVEDHLTRKNEGLGLGLAIAKGIVDIHKGRIWAESEGHKKGTTFTIVLPKHQSG